MSLFEDLDLDAIKATYSADLPTPIDVLNLIHFKDEEAYKWYGLSVLPLLRAVGAEVGWMGKHVRSLLGEPRAEELLVVRYPNQRRFFALALNPYYLLVANRRRLKGVRKFEASFTHSPDTLDRLRASKWVLAVHCHEAPDTAQRIIEGVGAELVYRSVETSPIKITKREHPANTNPLMFRHTALFRFDERSSCEGRMEPSVLNRLRDAAGELSVQLYQRVPKSETLPQPLSRWIAR